MVALIYLLLVSLAGYFLTRIFRLRLLPYERVVYGVTLGVITTGYVSLAMSHLTGFTALTQWLALLPLAVAAVLGYRMKQPNDRLEPPTLKLGHWLTLALLAALFTYLGATTYVQQLDGSYWINNSHNYGDIRLHTAYILNFVDGQNVPVTNPIYAGGAPSYPFLINLIAAQLVVLGLPLMWAINGLSILFHFVIIGILFTFAYRLTRNTTAATLAPILFLLSGGIGFLTYFIPEWAQAGFTWEFLRNLPHDYTMMQDNGYWFANMYIAFFNTQRAFLIGFPLTLIIVLELLKFREKSTPFHAFVIGLFTAFLTLVHTSSLVVVALMLPYLLWPILQRHGRDIKTLLQLGVAYAVAPLTFGLFIISTYISQSSSLLSLMWPKLGWMANTEPVAMFWLKNAGPALILVTIGIYLWRQKQQQLVAFTAASFVLFLLANTVITQPWDFDNSKYLVYWYAFLTPMLGLVIAWIANKTPLRIAIVGAIILLLIASGALDLWRRVLPTHRYEIVSGQEIIKISDVKEVIPPQNYVLTYGHVLNPMVSFLGRPFIYGDTAWLWSHGISGYETRQRQVERIYAGSENAAQLIQELNVDYIIVSPHERERLAYLNEEFLASHFTRVYDEKGTVVYKVSR